MLIHEMTEDECRAELSRTDFGRLACVRDADLYHWMSALVFGRYEEIPDTPKYQPTRAHALEVLQKRTIWWEPACVPNGDNRHRPPIFYRIEIEQMTGRRAIPSAIEPRLRT